MGGACVGTGGLVGGAGSVGSGVGTNCVVGTRGCGTLGSVGGIMDGGKGENLGGGSLGGVTVGTGVTSLDKYG